MLPHHPHAPLNYLDHANGNTNGDTTEAAIPEAVVSGQQYFACLFLTVVSTTVMASPSNRPNDQSNEIKENNLLFSTIIILHYKIILLYYFYYNRLE